VAQEVTTVRIFKYRVTYLADGTRRITFPGIKNGKGLTLRMPGSHSTNLRLVKPRRSKANS